jgi:hypothetical protein
MYQRKLTIFPSALGAAAVVLSSASITVADHDSINASIYGLWHGPFEMPVVGIHAVHLPPAEDDALSHPPPSARRSRPPGAP